MKSSTLVAASIALLMGADCAPSSQSFLQETGSHLVVTSLTVINQQRPIGTVIHDSVGQWTVLPYENPAIDLQVTVTIADIVKADSTVREVLDMPRGWKAYREKETDPWKRRRL